jgi:PHD/YefM family antitoxin component YafN of YafNO toxin-antitoxin module
LSERYVERKNGTPTAVVMGAEAFEEWVETLEVLSKPKTFKSLRQGVKEVKADKFKSFEQVFGEPQ